MSFNDYTSALTSSFTILVLCLIIKQLLSHKKFSRFPGPNLNIFQRAFMFVQYNFVLTVPEFANYWLSKYGKTVGVYMLKNYTILTSDRNLIKEVLNGPFSKNFVNRMGHSEGLSKIGMHNNGVIWNNDKAKWKMSREAFEKNFSHKHLEQVTDIATLKIKQVIEKLKNSDKIKLIKNGDLNYEVELLNLFRHVTLAVVLEVCFGVSIDERESEILIKAIVDYFKAWEFYLLKSNRVSSFFYPFVSKMHLKSVSNLNNEIDKFIDKNINDFDATPFLSTLKENNFSKEEIRQNILEMILAGTDTSSVSLYYTVLLLAENPSKMNELIESIENDPKSTYIENVLKEAMRILPVGPVIIRQAIDDCILKDDVRIKKGTNIILHLARMNRDTDYFEDPLVFKPERFADKNQSENFFPMGKGPKSCVGQYFAMTEMKPILTEFIKSFHVLRISNTKCIAMKTKWDIAQQPVLEENVALMPKKNIILVGAHSVGKTTLANYIANKLNCAIDTEIARDILNKMGVNGEQIRKDPIICYNFQKRIIQNFHTKIEICNKNLLVQDRCAIDALVYSRYFLGENNENCHELFNMNETKRLVKHYKQESIVFLIKPNEICLKNDGVRMMPESIKEWNEFSSMFEKVMTELNIEYFLIDKLNLNDRFLQVLEKISFN